MHLKEILFGKKVFTRKKKKIKEMLKRKMQRLCLEYKGDKILVCLEDNATYFSLSLILLVSWNPGFIICLKFFFLI